MNMLINNFLLFMRNNHIQCQCHDKMHMKINQQIIHCH